MFYPSPSSPQKHTASLQIENSKSEHTETRKLRILYLWVPMVVVHVSSVPSQQVATLTPECDPPLNNYKIFLYPRIFVICTVFEWGTRSRCHWALMLFAQLRGRVFLWHTDMAQGSPNATCQQNCRDWLLQGKYVQLIKVIQNHPIAWDHSFQGYKRFNAANISLYSSFSGHNLLHSM